MSALPKWDETGDEQNERPIRALLLDDSAFDRRRILRCSEKSRLPVEYTEVPSLRDMSRAMEHEAFDLFLVDYQLPEGNGLNAVEMIQGSERNQDAAVIMVTGQQQQQVAISAMRQGCHDLIAKDEMSPAILRERMTLALERVRSLARSPLQTTLSLDEPVRLALHSAMQSEAMQRLIEDGMRRALRAAHLPTGLSEAGRIDALLSSFLQEDEFHFNA